MTLRVPVIGSGADWTRKSATAVNQMLTKVKALEDAGSTYVLASEKGAADGVAELDSGGKVPASQLAIGWTQIGTSTPTGTGTVTFSSIPATYSDLLLVFEGVSHNDGSARFLSLALSADGSTFSTAVQISAVTVAAAATIYGSLRIPGYRFNAGQAVMVSSDLTTSPSAGGGIAAVNWRVSGGIVAVRIAWSAGNYDAGTLTLYGR
jgi:hypothetical protein